MFSILINPCDWNIPTARWPLISLTTGAALCQALETLVADEALQLKWPNDVYLSGKKICGILIESSPEATERLILGIGLNVNNDWSAAPDEIQRSATSLKVATGRDLSRMAVLTAMLRELDASLHELGRDPALIVRRCRARCWLTGHFVTVTELDRQVNGTCLGLDDDGALLVMTEHGPQRVLAGSVERHD